jgi:hypothetical protein
VEYGIQKDGWRRISISDFGIRLLADREFGQSGKKE